MKGANADLIRLLHVMEAIAYIESFLNNKAKQDLYEDHLVRFAVERQLEIIGEAANHISDDLKLKFPYVEWRRIVGFRNFLAHEYFGVDLELVWDIVHNKIPSLKVSIQNILSEIQTTK